MSMQDLVTVTDISIFNQEPADHMDFLGKSFDFYEDPYGRQVFTFLDRKKLSFGLDNTQYKDDLKELLTLRRDIIEDFGRTNPVYTGAILRWADNGDCRDIMLSYWGRVLKVYLVVDPHVVNLERIKQDSWRVATKFVDLDNESAFIKKEPKGYLQS